MVSQRSEVFVVVCVVFGVCRPFGGEAENKKGFEESRLRASNNNEIKGQILCRMAYVPVRSRSCERASVRQRKVVQRWAARAYCLDKREDRNHAIGLTSRALSSKATSHHFEEMIVGWMGWEDGGLSPAL